MEAVTCTVADGVAHLELNRPDAANSLDLDLARDLRAAVDRATHEDGVRAVLVTGAGKRFCAGGDVVAFATASDPAAYLNRLATDIDEALRALTGLDKPVVGVVHGAVAGAGLAVMLSCDVVVADPGTKFVFAYPSIGLTPDCGVSWLLPRAVGTQRALSFALSEQPLTADTALDWGLVTEVVPDAADRGRSVATALASGAAGALGLSRQLIRAAWDSDRPSAAMRETAVISPRVATPETQSLIAQFLARSASPTAAVPTSEIRSSA